MRGMVEAALDLARERCDVGQSHVLAGRDVLEDRRGARENAHDECASLEHTW